MDNQTKKLIQSYILDYLKLKIDNFEIKGKNGKNLFKCPLAHEHPNEELSANIFPLNSNKVYCFDPQHKQLGDIFNIVRILEPTMKELNDDEIGNYLIDLFKIQTNNKIEKLLALYESLNWSLVPLRKGGKEADIETEWQLKEHRNKREWKTWLENGINIGVNCALSNLLILDIDAMPKKIKDKWYEGILTDTEKEIAKKEKNEKIELILNKLQISKELTIYQESIGGIHLFFIADKEIPKTFINFEGVHIDIETGNGQVVLEPSKVANTTRKIYGTKIANLPVNVKALILENTSKISKPETINEDFELTFENLNNNRNNTFIGLCGKLRKKANIEVTSYALYLFNQLLDKQVPAKELRAMIREAEKYHKIDMEELSKRIIERLEKIEEATIRDLTYSLRQEQKDIEDCLRYLCDKDLIYKKGTRYKLIPKIEWRTDFLSVGKPIDFEIPWFSKYANFDDGNMIVLGGKSGSGKTHVVANMILKFKEQGIKPYLISTERGSKIGLVCATLGINEGDYEFFNTTKPWLVPFKKNAVTIIDWLKPPNSDYAKTDLVYEKINDELTIKGGNAIVFAQLRKSNGEFFATDQIDQYAALCAYFRHPEQQGQNGNMIIDNMNPYWETRKIRDSKTGQQHITIPLSYDKATKKLIEK